MWIDRPLVLFIIHMWNVFWPSALLSGVFISLLANKNKLNKTVNVSDKIYRSATWQYDSFVIPKWWEKPYSSLLLQ